MTLTPPAVDGIAWRRATADDTDEMVALQGKVYATEGLQYETLEVDTVNLTAAAWLYANLGFERVRGYINYTSTIELGEGGGGNG